MTDHDHIITAMRRDAIAEALAYYGLGELGRRVTVNVYGTVRSYGSIVYVTLTNGRRVSPEFEWLISSIDLEYDSAYTAVINVPMSFVTIFNLALYVLDDEKVRRRMRNVEMWNVPYLPPVSGRQVEIVGGVRI